MKAQKWKSTKFLLILLLFVAFFEACRQKEILPEKTSDSIDPATLTKIQNWYNPKVERLKKQKNAGTDIYLPQWGQGKLHTLPNGEKIALFPVHREKSVQYYDIGFVRRFAVYLTPQDSVKEVRLVEMIAPKAYLRQHKETLAKRYVLGDTAQWKQVVWSRKLDLPSANKITSPGKPCIIKGKTWYLWSSTGNCYITIQNDGNCGMEGSTFPVDCPDDGGGGPSTGGWNPPPPPTGGGNPPDSGNPADGNPSSGGNGGSPIYTEDPPPPCSTCPVDGFEDPGDNTNNPPPDVKATLKPSFANNPKAKCLYDKIVQNPKVKELLKDFNNPMLGFNLTIGTDPLYFPNDTIFTEGETHPVNGNFKNGNIEINIDSNELANISEVHLAKNIIHELIHAHIIAKIAYAGGLDSLHKMPELKKMYVAKKDFKLNIWRHNEAQHQYMAKVYFNLLVEILMEVDGNRKTKIYYEAMAWEGLHKSNQFKVVNDESERKLIELRQKEFKNYSIQNKLCN